jgi:non-canonical poly(A) RNA polymerase PAPD5/7
MFVLKYILKLKELNEVYTGGIGSFSLLLMIISFLQHRENPNRATIGDLLIDFCEFYGSDFNFYSTGISVTKGGSYFSKETRGWYNEQRAHLLAIEDPNDPENVS